ncbi:MAG: hypothetical protein ISR65_13605 [Bacteriovoracaceae bacterium]|nr:hypothetical protein [Bacteriovoracaceae bacterium]
MSTRETIVGIYSYLQLDDPSLEQVAKYYLLYIFNDHELIDRPTLNKTYISSLGKKDIICHSQYLGPFDDISEMNRFIVSICMELNIKHVGLFSVHDYNVILEKVTNISDLWTAIKKHCHIVESNTDKNTGGFFGKFFH